MLRWFESTSTHFFLNCRRGGTGRRPGLKIPWVVIPVPVRSRSPARCGAHTLAQIAQMVEQRTENPRVVGSIPTLGTPKSEEVLDIRNRFVYNTMRARVVEWYYASLPRRSSRVRSPSRALFYAQKPEHEQNDENAERRVNTERS